MCTEPKVNTTKEVFFKWFMFTATLFGLGLLTAFYPLHGNIPLIVIPSILVLIFCKPVFFEKMKLSTLLAMRLLIILPALHILDGKLYTNIVLFMLLVNILEATFTDIVKFKKIYNGISGIAVGLGILVLNGTWLYDAPIGEYYLAQSTAVAATVCYILAYTLWNWMFVTHEFSPSVALMHVGFLLAPILGCFATWELGVFGGFGLWLVLRANTLSIGGWLQIGCKRWFEHEFAHPQFAKFVAFMHTDKMEILCMVINIALIAVALVLGAATGCLSFLW